MSSAASTLYVTIDASGAKSGATTVNAQLNSIVNQTIILNNTINNLGTNTANTTRQMGFQFSSLRGYFRSLSKDLSSISGLIGAFQPVNMFRSYIDELINVNREYSSFIAMMNVTTGDIEKSGQAYEYVKGAAMSYGTSIKGLMKGYSQLTAATKGLMTELDTKRLFESVAAVTTVMHSTPQTVERIYNSFIQMASKGKVSMEELRQQFGEHVPGALQIGADAMGMTIDKFIDQVQKGGMSSIEFLKRLPDELFRRFGEAAEIASKSLHASLQRLKNTFFDIFKDMSTNGAALGISAVLQSITKKIDSASPAFLAFSEILGRGFLSVAKFIDELTAADVTAFTDGIISATEAFVGFIRFMIDVVNWLIKYGDEVQFVALFMVGFKLGVLGVIIPLGQASAAMIAAGGSAVILGRGLILVQGFLKLLAAFAAGWMFGKYLAEKFEIVEQFGRQMVNALVVGFEYIRYAAQVVATAFPHIFEIAFEKTINSINSFMATVANMGVDVANAMGFNLEKMKPLKLNFTSTYKKEMDALNTEHEKQLAIYKAVNADMEKDISAKHSKIKTGSTGPATSIADEMGLTKEKIKSVEARLAELAALGSKPYDPNADPMNGSAKGKKKSSTLVHDAMDEVSKLNEAYSTLTEHLKYAIEDGALTINQAFDAQVVALTKFTDAEKTIITEALSVTKNVEERKNLNNKLIKVEDDYQQALTKLNRENLKNRKKEQEAADQAMIDSGALRLGEVNKFIAKWKEKEGVMADNAKSAGDMATYNKFITAKQAEIDKLNKSDRKTVDTFFGTADDVWLIDVTEKYEKMRRLIQDSSAFTVAEQAKLIAQLDSQMEFMTPTMNRIESVVTGSFDKMADALVQFTQTGKLEFGSLITSMIADMVKLELKADMTAIWKNLGGLSGILGSFGGPKTPAAAPASSSGSGDMFSGLFSGISSMFQLSGARALGGPVLAGRTYMVGENGPERFTASNSGDISPSAPQSSQNITVNVPAGSPAETRRAAGAGARDALNAFNAASRYK